MFCGAEYLHAASAGLSISGYPNTNRLANTNLFLIADKQHNTNYNISYLQLEQQLETNIVNSANNTNKITAQVNLSNLSKLDSTNGIAYLTLTINGQLVSTNFLFNSTNLTTTLSNLQWQISNYASNPTNNLFGKVDITNGYALNLTNQGQTTIPDFTLAQHGHTNASSGGQLDASVIVTGTIDPSHLGGRTITGVVPIFVVNGDGISGNPTLLMPKATSTNDGYLDKTDWITFALKQNAFTTGTGLTNQSGVLSNNIVAGSNVTINQGANGQLTIAASASGSGAPVGTVVNTTSTTAGQLAQFTDNQVTNIAPVTIGLGLTNNAGVLSNNIVSGPNVAITQGANGQLTISSIGASYADQTLVGNISGSSSIPSGLTAEQVRNLLGLSYGTNYIPTTNGFGYGLSTTNLTNNGVNLQTSLNSKALQSNVTIVSNQVTGKLNATNGLSIGLTNVGSLVTGSLTVTNNGASGAVIFANNGSGGSANQQLAKSSNWAINGDHAGDLDIVSLQQINISANNGTTDNLTITSGGINVTGSITSTLTAKAPYFKPANDQFVVMGDSMSNDSIDWPNRLPLFDSIENRSFYTNFAIAGQTLVEIDANYASQAGSVVPTTNSYRWGEVFAGHNDIKTNATAIATFAHLTNVLFKLSTDGYFRTVYTMPPGSDLTGSKETERVAYNALIRSNPQLYDVLIPVDVLLPDNLNTNYYDPDGIHPNVNGSDVIAFFRAKTIRTKPWFLIPSGNYNSLPPNLVLNPGGRFTGIGNVDPWTTLTVGGNTANGSLGLTNSEAAPYRAYMGIVGLTNLITGDVFGDLSIVSYNNHGINWSANAGTTLQMFLSSAGNLSVTGNITGGATLKGNTLELNKNSLAGTLILSNTVAGGYYLKVGIAGGSNFLINGDKAGDTDFVSYNNSGDINFSADAGNNKHFRIGQSGIYAKGFVDATNGFKVNGGATSGQYLRGNGTVFTNSSIAVLVNDLTGTATNLSIGGNAVTSTVATNLANNQGTTTTVLHGNASGAPSFSAVTEPDFSFTDITTANATTSKHGLLAKLDGNSAHYLDGTGSFSTPAGGGSGGLTNWVSPYNIETNVANFIVLTNYDITMMQFDGGSGGYSMPIFTSTTNADLVGRVIGVKNNFTTSQTLHAASYPNNSTVINGVTNFFTLSAGQTAWFLAESPSVVRTNYNWELVATGLPTNFVTLTTTGGTPDFSFSGNGTSTININVANAQGTGQLVKMTQPGIFYPNLYFDGSSGILFKSQADGGTKMQLLYPATGADANMIQFYSPASPIDLFLTEYIQGGRVDFVNATTINLGGTTASLDFTNRLNLVGLTNALSVRNYASNAPAALLSSHWPVTKTTNYTITALDSGTTFNNQGSTSNIVLTLPATVVGETYKITQNTTDGITINAPSGSTIRAAGLTNSSYTLNLIGSVVELEAVNTTNWFVLGQPNLVTMTNDQPIGASLARLNFVDTSTVTWAGTNDATGSGKMNIYATSISSSSATKTVTTTPYTVLTTDDTMIFSVAAPIANLPSAVGLSGKHYTFICPDITGGLEIDAAATEHINTGSQLVTDDQGSVTIISDGTQWYISSAYLTIVVN